MAATIVLCVLFFHGVAGRTAQDPFAFLQPTVTVTAADRRQLDRGEPVARVVAGKGKEVAVFAAVRVDIDGDRLVAWMRRIEALKKSSYVLEIGRFSHPPVVRDLEALTLDEQEAWDILECRTGSCGLKLSATEMSRLQRSAADAGGDRRPAMQQTLRAILVARVETYLAGGHAALPPYENHGDPIIPGDRFAAVLQHSTFMAEHFPQLARYLEAYPRVSMPGVESFVYWSKERVGGKAIISATHVNILRSRDPGLPDTLVAGAGISATHYLNASLGITAVVRDEAGEHNYLVYLNRSDVDLLGGFLGALIRPIVQRRLRDEAGSVLEGLRRRLESGDPPCASFPLPEFQRTVLGLAPSNR